MNTNLKIGIFGGGVVGGGVYEIISQKIKTNKFKNLGLNIVISKICVRSLDKKRDYICFQNSFLEI